MKSVILYSLIFLSLFASSCGGKKAEEHKVITFNIRYDNPRDSINAWPNRKALVCEFLKTEKPDLFGLQEALWYQYEAIDSAVIGYSSVAVGRDDGRKKGEMNPLFYSTAVFDYVRDSTFWLSPTPSVAGSKGWGASLPRIVTWVELREKPGGKQIFYFNTHFAHDSDSARIMSAGILLKEVRRIAGKNRFIITGDFNMRPDSRAYSIMTQKGAKHPFITDSFTISATPPEGPEGTTNGWSDIPRNGRIDYVFVRYGMRVRSIAAIVKKDGPVFISDHWPVTAVVEF
jgi:endonuclease/exonuclease/phosphatase family metal-dependent hydrolase